MHVDDKTIMIMGATARAVETGLAALVSGMLAGGTVIHLAERELGPAALCALVSGVCGLVAAHQTRRLVNEVNDIRNMRNAPKNQKIR